MLKREIENPMILTQRKWYAFPNINGSSALTPVYQCGCGKEATHIVEGQEHCHECVLEAIDSTVDVRVRRI